MISQIQVDNNVALDPGSSPAWESHAIFWKYVIGLCDRAIVYPGFRNYLFG